jgi:hypothetical protein
MRKALSAILAILCLVVLGVGWLLFDGTGSVDDGVGVVNSHRAQIEQILRLAKRNHALEGVWASSPCNTQAGPQELKDCSAIKALMRQLPATSLNLDRDKLSGKISWVNIELLRQSPIRPPIEAEWGEFSPFPREVAGGCKATAVPEWRVCPGRIAWP